MKIIEDLYCNMSESVPCDEEKEIIALIDRNEECLIKMMTEVQKERFEKLCDCNDELLDICTRQAFVNGFSLGAKIVIEAIQN